jgi:hypothetical protein
MTSQHLTHASLKEGKDYVEKGLSDVGNEEKKWKKNGQCFTQ